ncbi:MAG: hypothetical protein WA775_03650 [Psychroserpens sp.]|uniref:hypothetical protein n=1 Tax=Psychroserpens sp. TaxID=2020870 RepID=UPI003C7625E2
MKRILITLSLAFVLFSCSNDDTTNTNIQEIDNFYALTVGNSWVYKNYRYDVNTQLYEDTGVVDSLSIIAAEDILGINYFKFRRLTSGNEEGITFCNENGEHFEYLREFEGNLIRSDGSIKFTNSNYAERILSEPSYGTLLETLTEDEVTLAVEAGTFDCVYSERYLITTEGEQLEGLDKFYYADGFGLIYDTSSFASQGIPTIIRHLDSYSIQ